MLRIQTILRRAAGHAQAEIRAGALCLDTQTGTVTQEGVAVRLTAFEHRLLSFLMHHRDAIVTRTQMSEHLYDSAADRDFRSLEVIIGRLRRKLGPERIETVRGTPPHSHACHRPSVVCSWRHRPADRLTAPCRAPSRYAGFLGP